MRLTRRGKIVVYGLPIIVAGAVGFLTAEWCWYGYCGL
jgi:hypothetical protein